MAPTKAQIQAAEAIKAGSVLASSSGTVSDFQRETLQRAEALGFQATMALGVLTLIKGKTTIKVIHSDKGYVRTVNVSGKDVILPGSKLKHKTLQSMLFKLA